MHFFDTFSTSEPPKVVRDRQFLTLLTSKCASRPTACTFSTSQLPKVVRGCGVLYILTWKCASRHNGVHFFDIGTSKSGPTLVCFVHFDLEMCFAPQRRALFRQLNFQKWSDPLVLCHFSLGNVLRATTTCNFFLSHLASWLRTRRFSEPTFRPSGATNHWKNTVNRDFPIFSAHLHLLSSDLFSSDSSHLCFSTVHIVGSIASKLPSTKLEQRTSQYYFVLQSLHKTLPSTTLYYQ